MCYQLSGTCNFECSFLYDICNLGNITITCLFNSCAHYPRTGNADINNTVRFSRTMKCACHKWVIFRSITEHYQFCSTNTVSVGRQFCCLTYHFTHFGNSIHVNTCFCRTDINRGTNKIRFSQSLRNTGNQCIIACTEAFMYQSGISADKVNADFFCGFIQSMCKINWAFSIARACQHSNRRNRDSFINNRNPIFFGDIFTRFHQVFGIAANFIINFCTSCLDIRINTIQQRDTHCNGAYIQMFVVYHIDGF